MSSFRALVYAVVALLVINYVSAIIGNCPPKHKVISNKHTCSSDADCRKFSHQICCLNQYNVKTCTPGSPSMSRDDGKNKNKDKYNGGGRPDVYRPYNY